MVKTRYRRLAQLSAVAVLAIAAILPAVLASRAQAATLTVVMVRFDRMLTSEPTTGTVCARPATTSADVLSWQVAFPTGYTVSTTAANWQTANISTTNLGWPSGAAAWPGATTATAGIAGQTVTWTNGAAQTMNNTTTYCYNWTSTSALSIKSSATSDNSGSVTTRNSGASTIDTANYATASVGGDTIAVSATVPQSFSFSLSGSTDALGTLSSGSVTVSPTPRTATVNTNAKSGWLVWAKDSNTGLNSTSASATIASGNSVGSVPPGTNTTLSSGNEGYVMGVTSSQGGGSGTITVATGYVGGVLGRGGGLDTSLRQIATSNGTASNAVLTLTNNASISTLTPAATDYSDTITVVGAGLF